LPGPPAPRRLFVVSRPDGEIWGLLKGPKPPPTRSRRAGFAVATTYPLGNCIGIPVETSGLPDSARSRFLIAPCRAAPDSHFQMVATPSRGAGEVCLAPDACAPCGGEARTSFGPPFPGCPGLSLTGDHRFFHAGAEVRCRFAPSQRALRPPGAAPLRVPLRPLAGPGGNATRGRCRPSVGCRSK
jgi:hypothetical protein